MSTPTTTPLDERQLLEGLIDTLNELHDSSVSRIWVHEAADVFSSILPDIPFEQNLAGFLGNAITAQVAIYFKRLSAIKENNKVQEQSQEQSQEQVQDQSQNEQK
jgi:hypothetical protein